MAFEVNDTIVDSTWAQRCPAGAAASRPLVSFQGVTASDVKRFEDILEDLTRNTPVSCRNDRFKGICTGLYFYIDSMKSAMREQQAGLHGFADV